MALSDRVVLIAGLCEIALPSKTIRLCDGGFVLWPEVGTFTAKDPDFGTIGAVEASGEAISDQAPGGKIVLLPPSSVSAAALFQPDAQGAPIRFWLAEVDRSSGAVVGSPELMFDGLVDTLTLKTSRAGRTVELEYMAAAERLFMVREGNVLSPRWHKSIWPGELGLDHVTGTAVQVPWGVSGPGRGVTSWSHITNGGGFPGSSLRL